MRDKNGKFIKGHKDIAFNHKANQTSYKKGHPSPLGRNHPSWKGKNAGLTSKHDWVKRRYGKPSKCEFCGSKNNVQWANISGSYKRIRSDWLRLCAKCHHKFDNISKKIWEARRKNKK